MLSTQWESNRAEWWQEVYYSSRPNWLRQSFSAIIRSEEHQHQTLLPWAMSLPEDHELDRKRPMVSPAAVQRIPIVTVSHQQPLKGLFTHSDSVTVKVYIVSIVKGHLMSKMGGEPILPVTIVTIIKLDGDKEGDGFGMCKQALRQNKKKKPQHFPPPSVL